MVEKLVKMTRTLTYIGPESWVRQTQSKSFVVLAKELGHNRVITSEWLEPPVEVSAEFVEGARTEAMRVQRAQEGKDG